jgi:hypothetical protein
MAPFSFIAAFSCRKRTSQGVKGLLIKAFGTLLLVFLKKVE